MQKKNIHFIGFLANVDDSLLKLDLGQPFTIEKKSQGDASSFLCHIRQHYGTKSEDGILAVEDRVNGIVHNQSFYYYCITASNIESFEATPQGGVVIRPDALERSFYPLRDKVRLLRLFKEGNIMMRFSLFYYLEGSEPKVVWSIREGPLSDGTIFKLKPYKVAEAQDFIKNAKIPFDRDFLNLAFDSFELSYETHTTPLGFLSLMIAMETLLNLGENEIRYSVSRNAGVLLGEKREQSEEIFKEIKELYGKRSKMVHTGKADKMTRENLLRLRGFVREAIKEIHRIGEDKAKLLDLLNQCGFGERPWRERS
jgi:hypothetical protein